MDSDAWRVKDTITPGKQWFADYVSGLFGYVIGALYVVSLITHNMLLTTIY